MPSVFAPPGVTSVPWWWTRLVRWLALTLAVPPPEGAEGEVTDLVVVRAQRGDHQAFAEIVRRYDDRLRALAFRLLGSADRMDDVLQEAYVKAYRALPSFRGEAKLGTWLYRITYNACMDELRKLGPVDLIDDARAGVLDGAAVERASLAPDPGEVAVTRSSLAAALASLPADQRAAVLLVDADGFDYAAAAEILGVRAGTVASRLNRARTALRQALKAEAS